MTVPDLLRACGLPGPYGAARPVGGGCINETFAVDTGAGPVFLKTNARAPSGFFAAERAGLEALRRAAEITGADLVVPRVLGLYEPDGPDGSAESGNAAMALEWLEPAPPTRAMWETLGRGLARLHGAVAPRHGFGRTTWLGATPQPNDPTEDWGDFFAARRIGHLLRLLDRSGTLPESSRRVYDALFAALPARLAHAPPASLLHGDLWNGNALATTRGPALIDPAAHHGDRECDLAMMRLFGGFPETVFDAYRETWPLAAGWREREPIYRLYHLLNHQLLFGGGYGAEALATARALL